MKGNREALWQILEVCLGMKDKSQAKSGKRRGGLYINERQQNALS